MITLKEIVRAKRRTLLSRQRLLPQTDLERRLATTRHEERDYFAALQQANQERPDVPAIIAEIKSASPSEGIIHEQPDVQAIAKAYTEGGATALSVVSEADYFDGSLERLVFAKRATHIPILRKDFIIDPYQLYESKLYHADAVLLIAHIVSTKALKSLYQTARDLNMSVIVEVHSEEDIEKAMHCDPRIIGVNSRDLTTMEVDLKRLEKLCDLLPQNKILVAESGITSAEDVDYVRSVGANAVLVGTALMKSANQKQAVRELNV